MSRYHIINSKIIYFIFLTCLISPNISFSSDANSETPANINTTQQTNNPSSNANQQKKEVLAADRELDSFFIIGLIINLIMMTSFAIWAAGQWRQNDKKNKASSNSSRKMH